MGLGLRWAWRAWIVGGVVTVLGACESPTLPLPPPELPEFSTQDVPAGEVRLTSRLGAEPNALIVTYNLDPNIPLDKRVGGAQADALGSWDAIITAVSTDEIEITQEIGSAMSPPETVAVP